MKNRGIEIESSKVTHAAHSDQHDGKRKELHQQTKYGGKKKGGKKGGRKYARQREEVIYFPESRSDHSRRFSEDSSRAASAKGTQNREGRRSGHGWGEEKKKRKVKISDGDDESRKFCEFRHGREQENFEMTARLRVFIEAVKA